MRAFFDMLFPPRGDERTLRAISKDQFLVELAPTLVSVTKPETISLLSFTAPSVRAAIHEAKYHGNERAVEYLATVLAEYLGESDIGHGRLLLLPLPLGKQRRKERGANQVEEVAKRAIKLLDKDVPLTLDTSLLVRVRETASQVSLPRDKREENVRGAFQATRPLDPAITYLLIDDVITTGATLQAAIAALRSAGATGVIPLALAH